MHFKNRIRSYFLLLIFLSAWVPSSVAHAIDPHHDEVATTHAALHESDHCPYCELDLSAFTSYQPHFFTVSSTVCIFEPAVYIPSFSIEEILLISSRGPPAI